MNSVEVNGCAKYPSEWSFSSEVIVRPQKYTHRTECSLWTTNFVGNKVVDDSDMTAWFEFLVLVLVFLILSILCRALDKAGHLVSF